VVGNLIQDGKMISSPLLPLVMSAVLIFLLSFWIRKTGKLTWGEGVFFAVLTLILVTLVWLKLGG
jgi:hypothetical protein